MNSVNLPDGLRIYHGLAPKGENGPVLHHQKFVCKAQGQVQVVDDHHRRQVLPPHHLPGDVQYIQLIFNIQIAGRLIEQQHWGLLGQRPGNGNLLPFPAA